MSAHTLEPSAQPGGRVCPPALLGGSPCVCVGCSADCPAAGASASPLYHLSADLRALSEVSS